MLSGRGEHLPVTVQAVGTGRVGPGRPDVQGNCQWPGAAYHLSEIDGGPEITPHRRHRNARTSQPFCPHSVGQLECINERLGFAGLGVTRTRTRTRRTRPRPRIRWTRTNLDSDSDSSDSDSDSPDLDSDSDSPDSDSDSPDSRFPVPAALHRATISVSGGAASPAHCALPGDSDAVTRRLLSGRCRGRLGRKASVMYRCTVIIRARAARPRKSGPRDYELELKDLNLDSALGYDLAWFRL